MWTVRFLFGQYCYQFDFEFPETLPNTIFIAPEKPFQHGFGLNAIKPKRFGWEIASEYIPKICFQFLKNGCL